MTVRRQCDMGEFCPNTVDVKRIMDLSAKLHVYDAIAGDGDRFTGKALRKRLEEVETVLNVLVERIHTCRFGSPCDNCRRIAVDATLKISRRALEREVIDVGEKDSLALRKPGKLRLSEAERMDNACKDMREEEGITYDDDGEY